jgi:DHA2 family multidrug resistance protein
MKKLDYKWQVLMVVIFGSFMVILDSTIVNVTIPTFEKVFNTDVNGIQWILTGYLLALGIITPVAGYLADNFGIKKVYLLSLGFFVIGSALCGLSDVIRDSSGHPYIGTLIFFRVLQGIGGGATVPLANAQLFAAFPPEQRGLANGVFGVPLLVAPALGPTLGGYIAQYLHWSLIFYINVPIGIIGILMGLWLLKPSEIRKSRRFDTLGFGSAAIGLGLLLYALSEAGNSSWTDPVVLVCFGVAAVFLAFFAYNELRRDDAIVDLRLFKNGIFTLGCMVNWATVIALFGSAFLLPLYLQNVRGQSPFEAGLMLLPQAVTAALAVPFTGRLFDKFGPRPLVVTGLIVLTVTSFFFTRFTATTDLFMIEVVMALRGFALGCTVQPSVTTAISVMQRQAIPRGSSLINASRQVIQALGIAVLSTVFTTQVAGVRGQGQPNPTVVSQAFIAGFNNAFSVVLAVALAGVVVSFFTPGWPGQWPLKQPGNQLRGQPQGQGQTGGQGVARTGQPGADTDGQPSGQPHRETTR